MSAVQVTRGDGGVAVLRFNRPERFNALDDSLMDAASEALSQLSRDESCLALVVTGNGRAFCAGADLNAMDEGRRENRYPDTGAQVAHAMQLRFNPLTAALAGFPKPVVSAVNGIAAGGGAALALCADVVLCGASGKFKFVQAQQLSIVADLGAHWLLQRIAGRGAALAATLLGETLDAARAQSLGLAWDVVADDELLGRAVDAARKLAAIPRDVLIGTRALVDAAPAATFADSLETERLYQRDFCARREFLAHIDSFLAQQQRRK